MTPEDIAEARKHWQSMASRPVETRRQYLRDLGYSEEVVGAVEKSQKVRSKAN